MLAVLSVIPRDPKIITPDNAGRTLMVCAMIDPSFMATVPAESRAHIFEITSQYFHDLAQSQKKEIVP